MDLNEIWSDFAERMAAIELYQRAAKDITQKEQIYLKEYSDHLRENTKLKNSSISLHNMLFINARTGEKKPYNFKELSLEERKLQVLLHKNKQYKWLLAEAYEVFENYLENIYAYCGSINDSFWPLEDYGNVTLSELKNKNYTFYVERAKKKKGIPKSILERFKMQFPKLKDDESKNKLQVNLYFVIMFIAQLRHVIVHEGGTVSDKEAFIKKTTKNCDLFNDGNISPDHVNFINQFFGKNEYENLITLLEIKINDEKLYDINIYPFDILIDYLMSYAYLIYEHINSSIKRNDA
jgi:hypothetical protein